MWLLRQYYVIRGINLNEMKLELKHLAPYMPYWLKFVIDMYEFTDGNSKPEIRHFTMGNDISMCLNYGKPILRPIQEVELFFEDIWALGNDEDVKKYLDSDFLWENGQIEISEIQLIEADKLPYGTLQVLLKYHFDVFDLIEKGLAIDINTLSE
jgi:hypothetical protein